MDALTSAQVRTQGRFTVANNVYELVLGVLRLLTEPHRGQLQTNHTFTVTPYQGEKKNVIKTQYNQRRGFEITIFGSVGQLPASAHAQKKYSTN